MDKKEQNRKLFLFIPIPGAIAVSIFFILLGGGQGSEADSVENGQVGLVNTQIPEEEKGLFGTVVDKFTAYKEEEKNNSVRKMEEKKDPYKEFYTEAETEKGDVIETGKKYLKHPNQLSFKSKSDSLMESFEKRHSELEKNLQIIEKAKNEKLTPARSAGSAGSYATRSTGASYGSRASASSMPVAGVPAQATPARQDLSPELQAQLAAYEQASSQVMDEEDNQFSDMKDMLDKILDIQHPERVKQRLKEQSKKEQGNFYSVHNSKNHVPVDYLGEKEENLYRDRYHEYMDLNQDTVYKVIPRKMVSGFMGLTSDEGSMFRDEVKAVVHDGAVVTSGSKIKLRLLSDIVVKGREVRANSFIYGICTINGSRVDVDVESIQVSEAVVPVNMTVYDHDGMEGIYVNGLAEGKDARDAATNAGSTLDLQLANPTVGGRLVDNSVREVKNLLRRKAQAPKATLKSGHQIFLLNSDN